MKYVVRLLGWLVIWAALSVIFVLIALAVDPIEPGEGLEGEWAWQWWAGISMALLTTLVIAMIVAVVRSRRKGEGYGTDLRGGK